MLWLFIEGYCSIQNGFQKHLLPEVQKTKEIIPLPGGSIEGLERKGFRNFERTEFEVL